MDKFINVCKALLFGVFIGLSLGAMLLLPFLYMIALWTNDPNVGIR